MHLPKLLHKMIEEELPLIHKVRLENLISVCETAMSGTSLYLTGLGRSLSNTNKESSNIQKVDRLLGNGHLQGERELFYKLFIGKLICEDSHPWIHIDWSCINAVTNLYVLRASLSMSGRSIVLYEACYPKSKENNHATHKNFLNKLKTLLPQSVKPTIVTDAGFRAPWFAHILQLGWDFVGRLRNTNAVRLSNASDWCFSSAYYQQATAKPTYIGHGILTHEGKVPVHFVLYKSPGKGRTTLTLNKKRQRSSKKDKVYSKSNKEPWLLVTSLTEVQIKPFLAVNIYRQRMRIEENIRDTKSSRYGLGLKNSLTRCPQRINVLLLIALIVTFAAWLAGLFIKSIGKAADFQAHSARVTSALSFVFLGKRALIKKLNMTQRDFRSALMMLYQCTLLAQMESPHYG
jgi:hypothetical protein